MFLRNGSRPHSPVLKINDKLITFLQDYIHSTPGFREYRESLSEENHSQLLLISNEFESMCEKDHFLGTFLDTIASAIQPQPMDAFDSYIESLEGPAKPLPDIKALTRYIDSLDEKQGRPLRMLVNQLQLLANTHATFNQQREDLLSCLIRLHDIYYTANDELFPVMRQVISAYRDTRLTTHLSDNETYNNWIAFGADYLLENREHTPKRQARTKQQMSLYKDLLKCLDNEDSLELLHGILQEMQQLNPAFVKRLSEQLSELFELSDTMCDYLDHKSTNGSVALWYYSTNKSRNQLALFQWHMDESIENYYVDFSFQQTTPHEYICHAAVTHSETGYVPYQTRSNEDSEYAQQLTSFCRLPKYDPVTYQLNKEAIIIASQYCRELKQRLAHAPKVQHGNFKGQLARNYRELKNILDKLEARGKQADLQEFLKNVTTYTRRLGPKHPLTIKLQQALDKYDLYLTEKRRPNRRFALNIDRLSSNQRQRVEGVANRMLGFFHYQQESHSPIQLKESPANKAMPRVTQ